MSAKIAHSRGRPIAMLAVVGLGWITMRAFTWEAPFPAHLQNFSAELPQLAAADLADPIVGPSRDILYDALDAMDSLDALRLPPADAKKGYVVRVPLKLERETAPLPEFATATGSSGSHQMLWLAAMSQLPVPADLDQQVVTGIGANAPQPMSDPFDGPGKQRRWSADAWVLWRQGSGIAQGRRPSYGASQAGAVFNYRLKPSSSHDPRVFVRGYRALIDNPETELSLGLSARPLGDIPVRVHAEVRATERFDETEIRPSAFITTELPPQPLPFGAEAEFYAQAGYVGGDFPTHFADGQVHVMREVHDFELAKVSVGAAAWGGIQKGASRVDVGPSVRVNLNIGPVPARISLDYREQVAGDAEPGSGLAVTVATHF
ncbi:hypothetical protein ACRAQ6_06820 [Erythrobacter sp. HA6-11]